MKVIIEIDEKTFAVSAALLTHKAVDTEEELQQMNRAVEECRKAPVEIDVKQLGEDASNLYLCLGIFAITTKLQELKDGEVHGK